MASTVIEKIKKCVEEKQNFVLDAGAGSGKTWTLVESLKYLLETKECELEKNRSKILCVTYTKAARDEIIERVERNPTVEVTTIHDFLWSAINQFKSELREALINKFTSTLEALDDEIHNTKNKGTKKYQGLLERRERYHEYLDKFSSSSYRVAYRNIPSYRKGIITHDDVIELSLALFSYDKMVDLVAAQYPYVFVDEYQDTHPDVMSIFLDRLGGDNVDVVLGFYGDFFQKIYDKGFGKIPDKYNLEVIEKVENFRCPKSVINLLNQIRPDLQQVPGKKSQAEGVCKFIESVNGLDDEAVLEKIGIKVEKTDKLKVLYLTHTKISKQQQYEKLFNLYNKRRLADVLTKNEDNRGREGFADYFFDLEELVSSYVYNKIQVLLKLTTFKVNTSDDKSTLRNALDRLMEIRDKGTFGDIFEFNLQNNMLTVPEKLVTREGLGDEENSFVNELFSLSYKEFVNMNSVNKQHSPYTTKHSTKGREYEVVFVRIDDEAWRNYNFQKYFSGTASESIALRTRNLFYVICSRTTRDLIVCYEGQLEEAAKNRVNELFNEENVLTV